MNSVIRKQKAGKMGVILRFMNRQQKEQIKTPYGAWCPYGILLIFEHIAKTAQGLFIRNIQSGLDCRGFQIGVVFCKFHNLSCPFVIAGVYQVSPLIVA